jgi:acyl carrier protein
MTREEMITKLAGWIGEITEADPPALGEDTHLVEDLGLDSLALAELAARMRLALKIKIKPGELRTDLRVGPVVDFVLGKLQAG